MRLEKNIPTAELEDVENLKNKKIRKINASRIEKCAPPE
jgi:hypothetical protein